MKKCISVVVLFAISSLIYAQNTLYSKMFTYYTEDLYNKAYSDGYSDGVKRGKEQYGQHSRGTARCTRATKEQIDSWGKELWGWCECGKAIE